ncbi:MAG: serine hydrolase, partial [bacterium]|nr:serine hydrolase [bacterium]
MSQNFLGFLFALTLSGIILFQSHLFPVSQNRQDIPVSPAKFPTPFNLEASLPTAVKLPGLPYLVIEDSAQFFPIRNWNTPSIELEARAGIAADFSSGRLFYQKNIDETLPIASLTKLMSALVVLENYNLDDLVKISKEAIMTEGDKGGLIMDEELSVEALLKIMLIESSNDAAVALAEKIGVQRFIESMNQRASDLNMSQTKFKDPAGLNGGNVSSVSDLLKLARHLFFVWPEIAEITKTQTATVSSVDGKINHQPKNTNKLLGKIPEILGGKTGYSDEANGCLLVLMQINEKNKIITVALGSPDR